MGKLSISMAMFYSYVSHNQRVISLVHNPFLNTHIVDLGIRQLRHARRHASSSLVLCASNYRCHHYPLVNVYIANWKDPLFYSWENPLFQRQFPIAILNYQRVKVVSFFAESMA